VESVHHLHPPLWAVPARCASCSLARRSGARSCCNFLSWSKPCAPGPTGPRRHRHGPDVVSEVNVVRQPFSRVDIGSNKAICLVGRITCFGLRLEGHPRYFGQSGCCAECDLLISCVDTRKARHLNFSIVKKLRSRHITSISHNASSGQYVLGQPHDVTVPRASEARLPTVFDLYPEIADATLGESTLPSCSAVEALDRRSHSSIRPWPSVRRHACPINAVRENLISWRLL